MKRFDVTDIMSLLVMIAVGFVFPFFMYLESQFYTNTYIQCVETFKDSTKSAEDIKNICTKPAATVSFKSL